jgi:hypothetical protein
MAEHGRMNTQPLSPDEVAELLGIPADVHQGALIPTAYYTGDTFRPAARVPLEEVIHLNRW